MQTIAGGVFASNDPYARIALAVLHALFGENFARGFAIELWEGTRAEAIGGERFLLRINDAGTLRAALRPPLDLNAGRAFASGLLEVEGDVEAAVDLLFTSVSAFKKSSAPRLFALLLRLPKRGFPKLREAALRGKVHSTQRDRAAIGFHYDQPVEFYRSFLDPELVYSCAYFDDGIDSLHAAQLAKLDLVLRKLQVKRGERLLDIGCGWGALVVRAAQKFGARVLGVTLSKSQYEVAQQRIAEGGLTGAARVELRDYRELSDEAFDKIASIGMFEHVGRANLPAYFAKAYALLRPGGLFLNHGISEQSTGRTGGKVAGFMERFIFPDGELVAVSDALQIAERAGFEVRDVENLREHYTRTLRAWVANLERNRDAAVSAAGTQAFRAWRLYMAGSAQGFRTGRMGLFQSLLAKPRPDGTVNLPATRRAIYVEGT